MTVTPAMGFAFLLTIGMSIFAFLIRTGRIHPFDDDEPSSKKKKKVA